LKVQIFVEMVVRSSEEVFVFFFSYVAVHCHTP